MINNMLLRFVILFTLLLLVPSVDAQRVRRLSGSPSQAVVASVSYLFQDNFTDTTASGALNGSASTPGPGSRSITGDTDAITSSGPYLLTLGIGDSKINGNYIFTQGLGTDSTRFIPIGTNIAIGGATLDSLATTLESGGLLAYSLTPDIILFGGGINSIDVGQANWESQYGRIADAIHTQWPAALMYCSRVWGTNRTAACLAVNTWTTNVASTRSWMRWMHDEQDWFQGSWNGSIYTFDSGDGTGLHPNTAGYCRQRDITTDILVADILSGALTPSRNGLVSRWPTNDFSPVLTLPSVLFTNHSVFTAKTRPSYVTGYIRNSLYDTTTRWGWNVGPNTSVYDGTSITVGRALKTFEDYDTYIITRKAGAFLLIKGFGYTYPTLCYISGTASGQKAFTPVLTYSRYGSSLITKARVPVDTFDISPLLAETWTGVRTGLGNNDGLTLGAQESSPISTWVADPSWSILGGSATNSVGNDVSKQLALFPCTTTDVIVQASITYTPGGTNHAGLILGYSSSSQYAKVYLSNNVIRLDAVIGGVVDNLFSSAFTYNAGTNLTVIWRPPTEARVLYGKAVVTSSTTASLSTFTNSVTHVGLLSNGEGTSFGPVAVWACGGDGRYSNLSCY